LPSHPHPFGAAEAAGAKGKFWPMHDLLYANQKQLEPDDLIRYAEQLDLDVGQFRRDLEKRTYRDAVQSDMQSGIVHGVTGTPTLRINGERYAGPRTRKALLEVLKGPHTPLPNLRGGGKRREPE
jgi:protein-disulfide isomerase